MNISRFFILVGCAFFICSAETHAARLVRATVSIDGKTILEGSTSDDGRVDADGVWEYLRSIRFKATEDFGTLELGPDSKTTVLSSKAPKGRAGTIIVEIAYGGRASTRELKLVRVPADRQGREWSIDPGEVDRMFNRRYIRRSDAARLDTPKKSKR